MATHPENTADSAISPVRVSGSPERVYSSADRETAFHVWHGPAGKSLRQTSAITGYPLTTLHDWSKRHDWQDRSAAASEQSELRAARTADTIVQTLITSGKARAIVSMLSMVADPSHKKHYEACEWMLAQGGYPTPKAPSITATRTLGDGTQVSVKLSDLSSLSPSELATYARTGVLPPGRTDVVDNDDTDAHILDAPTDPINE